MKETVNGNGQGVAHSLKRIIGILDDLRRNLLFNCVMLALLGAGIGLISLLLGATVFGLPMFKSYFSSTTVLLLNLLPVEILIFLFYFLFRRPWIAFTFPSLFIVIISMIQFFKIQIRGDPLVITDARLIFEVSTMMSLYTPTMNWKIYLAIAALVCGAAFSVFVLGHKVTGARVRVIAALSVVAVSAALYLFVYTNVNLYDNTTVDAAATEWEPNRKYITKGFLYPFVFSIKGTLQDSKGNYPEWYDKQEAIRLLESYGDAEIPDGMKVNIITLCLEAFCDFSRFDMIEFTEDVYGPLHRLQDEAVSGTLINNVFAGGTIDTERLYLTGYTQLSAYNSATNSYVHYLGSQGYYAEGLHTGTEWFYDRRPVNKHLGFKNFYFLDDYDDGSRDDSFYFPAVTDLYRARDKSVPYFSFNLSYQNHGSYPGDWTKEPYVIAQGNMSDESFNILNNYLSGIWDTNIRLEQFIDSLRDDPDPVVVVIFGDHMPWMGNRESVYEELGIDIDRGSEQGFYNYYSSPYVIWANEACKSLIGNDFSGDGGSFSPGFLMGEVFRQCSWEGEGYMQALRELRESIDIISTPTKLFRENGALTQELSPSGAADYQRFRMMEIYRRNNFMY